MSIIVTINGTDRTDQVEANSLKIENILTRKRDTCRFNILSHAGDSITPVVGQEVIITYDPGTGSARVFGGVIVELEQNALTYGLVRWEVSCQDYTRLLDRRLVPDVYTNMTANEIIADLADRYFPSDFTTGGVDADVVVRAVSFNYKPLSKCLDELANMIGYDWYVDYHKVLYFFKANDNPAPFEVTDTNGKHEYESLVIRRDNSQVRNTIIVRGGEYEAASFTAEVEADGDQTVFPLAYKFEEDSFIATLTGEVVDHGIDTVDDADDHRALYNRDEKILKFRDTRKPSAGAVLRYGGRPLLPVIVRQSSPAAISAMVSAEGGDGVYEHLILDKTITSKEAARQRAAAEIQTYATTLSEGEFRSYSHGLRAGQKIRINSASRGIDEYFVINKVTLAQFDSSNFFYQVSLITTRSFDLVDLLIQLALDNTKEIVINDHETSEVIINLSDAATLADSLGTFTPTSGPYYYDSTTFLDDSYNESNQNTSGQLNGISLFAYGQAFESLVGGELDSAKFYLRRLGSPTGNITARIYAMTGTYGTNGRPTGSPLAESDAIDVTTIGTGSFALQTFQFSGANRITLTAGTRYCVLVQHLGTDASNCIQVGSDNSSPTHSGNRFTGTNSALTNWFGSGETDVIFYVYVGHASGTTGKWNFAVWS